MSGNAPVKIDVVAWTGDTSQLAARLRLSESDLAAKLKALSRDKKGSRLLVEAPPANDRPILAALARLLNVEVAS